MLLANLAGINNHGKSFCGGLSFIYTEAQIHFSFIFQCLDKLVFYRNCLKPAVIISYQSAGFRAAIESFFNDKLSSEQVFHQLCENHILANIEVYVQRNR